MAETEAGWTKEDLKVDGVYWWRADRMDFEPDVHYVTNGKFYEVGEQFSRIVEGFGGEWLGPITVSDAEQLIELRKAGTRMMGVLETYKERHLVPSHLANALADLRDALGSVDRSATVQCADCLVWIDKNANHTCRQQVRRNRKNGNR